MICQPNSLIVASAMWPWFNSNPLLSMQDNSKKLSEPDNDIIAEEADKRSKSEKTNSKKTKQTLQRQTRQK